VRSLHRQLRAAIADGRLRPGLRLPATRSFAERLGVSRNTVIAAYDLLLSEGYIEGRGGSGTYVADIPQTNGRPASSTNGPEADLRLAPLWRNPDELGLPRYNASYKYDFRPGVPELRYFPCHVWRRLSARAQRALADERAVDEAPEGQQDLREAIAAYVSFARAVACRSDDVVVTSGTRQALDLLARILVTPGQTVVATEAPVFKPILAAFKTFGARLTRVPVDSEGLIVDRVPTNSRIICVSPSHQYPLGVAMSARRRAALLDFAQRNGAVIIEDDYDGEFRLEGQPIDALQTLDRAESVFYIGTFAKSMFPALRLGFVVVPPWARQALIAAKQMADGQCPVWPQQTLAAFIAEGHLARYVRKMRKIYNGRHKALLQALVQHCSDRLAPIAGVAGLHIAAKVYGASMTALDVVPRAREAGINLEPFHLSIPPDPAQTGLLLGYGLIEAEEIDPAIRCLASILN
jgi:GntR family transcriptional regulator/MocR family aminotransferase